MYYKVCPWCKAHLDPGETCDCEIEREQKRKEAEELRRQMLMIEKGGQLCMAFKELALCS